ncbi:4 [Octopus vulgaris]|uniref:Pecanex-like protein n=1 Tax=Octopus vulgaris TaxID=6645 RepID=A0AA36F7A6_OCTVU|nr:4 [Octopus vulgaris] [Octopus vulgaris]
MFTTLVELYLLQSEVAAYIFGAIMSIFVISVQVLSTLCQQSQKSSEAVVTKKHCAFSEDDEVEFTACCAPETLEFIVPVKKYRVNILIHSVISGVMCGLALLALLPVSNIKPLYNSDVAAVLLFLFGWLSVCIAQYSLTVGAPPEPATFRTMDTYEISHLMRPTYVFICVIVDAIQRQYPSSYDLLIANQVLHIFMACLPICWTFGMLPPIDAGLLWLVEQSHIFLLGGSPMASNLRSCLMLALSVCIYLVVLYMPVMLGSIVIAAGFGYLLSLDLGGLGTQLIQHLIATSPPPPTSFPTNTINSHHSSNSSCSSHNSNNSSSSNNNNNNNIHNNNKATLMKDKVTLVASNGAQGGGGCGFGGGSGGSIGSCGGGSGGSSNGSMVSCGSRGSGNDSWINGYSKGFMWSWGYREVLYHTLMTLCVSLESGVLYFFDYALSTELAWYSLGYITVGFCIVEKVLQDIQRVYIVFGLWRNPLYPHTVHRVSVYQRRKNILKVFGFLRKCIIKWAGPMVMIAYLIVCLKPVQSSIPLIDQMNNTRLIWWSLGIMRSFRWVWQSTVHSLFEVSLCHFFILMKPVDIWLLKRQFAPLLLLGLSLVRDRFIQFINKVFFFLTILITSLTDRKLRRQGTGTIFCLSILFLPVVLLLIAVTTVISAPLLPLFTLPLLFIGFPRPIKFWPASVGSSANICPDSIYYRQFAMALVRSLHSAFTSGSLGDPNPGNFYLVRFQDRLAWISVLEQGSSHVSISVKGLELQETTCHTVEATHIDTHFESTFEPHLHGSTVSSAFSWNSFNKYPFHTLTPYDAFPVQTYSDARSVLIGVIDSPNSLLIAKSYFLKSFVWLLLHHVFKVKEKKEEGQMPFMEKMPQIIDIPGEKSEKISMADHDLFAVGNSFRIDASQASSRPSTADSSIAANAAAAQRRKLSWASSVASFTDSVWSEDRDTLDNRKKAPMTVLKKDQISPITIIVQPRAKPEITEESEDDDLFVEPSVFGLPVTDINSISPQPCYSKNQQKKLHSNGSSSIYRPLTSLAGSPDFKCIYSSQLSLPVKWRELPIEPTWLLKLQDSFPRDWYTYVLGQLAWSATDQMPVEHVISEVAADTLLMNSYSQLTMACSSVFESQDVHSPASYLYKYYIGNIPWNAMWDWLAENKDLQTIVLKAFRYGFKLMMDEVLMNPITSHEELKEFLEDYDQNWFIGLESDPDWSRAILAGKPHLFSLGHNTSQATYTSRVLTLQDVMIQVGHLNPEVVRGQWANLSLELLYFTNDDEERYSIQAHPTILRNLTVQAADPPLGYPIFASDPISIPIL